MKSITIEEMKKQLSIITLIDIRDNYKYIIGKIPTAINIPMNFLLVNPENYLKKNVNYWVILYLKDWIWLLNTYMVLKRITEKVSYLMYLVKKYIDKYDDDLRNQLKWNKLTEWQKKLTECHKIKFGIEFVYNKYKHNIFNHLIFNYGHF